MVVWVFVGLLCHISGTSFQMQGKEIINYAKYYVDFGKFAEKGLKNGTYQYM